MGVQYTCIHALSVGHADGGSNDVHGICGVDRVVMKRTPTRVLERFF